MEDKRKSEIVVVVLEFLKKFDFKDREEVEYMYRKLAEQLLDEWAMKPLSEYPVPLKRQKVRCSVCNVEWHIPSEKTEKKIEQGLCSHCSSGNKERICPKCNAYYKTYLDVCPNCGFQFKG